MIKLKATIQKLEKEELEYNNVASIITFEGTSSKGFRRKIRIGRTNEIKKK